MGGGAPREFLTGLSRVQRSGEQGGERWWSGGAEVSPPPTSWEHSGGVKEARELRSNLGVKWEVLCPGKGCQASTVSHSYRRGSEPLVQSWCSPLFKGTHFPRRSSCRHTHRTQGEHLTISCVSSGKCYDVSVPQSPVCKVRVGIRAAPQGCGRW